MDEAREILSNFTHISSIIFNPSLKRWKDKGGKVVGLVCSYVPEELFTAAGILPYRMRATGSIDTSPGDPYAGAFTCSSVRHLLSLAFSGAYDFLDGIVIFNSCDHARRIYDIWSRKLNTPFQHYVNVPHKGGSDQTAMYRNELQMLKQSLENQFRVSIGDEDLWRAIKVHNQTRELQRKLYELKGREAPPITGAETLSILIAGTAIPKDEYNGLLRKLLSVLGDRSGNSDNKARLMMTGSCLDNPAYLQVFEELGGLIVTDLLCFGASACWGLVDETGADPLEALARYQLDERIPCARMVGQYSRRLGLVKEMVKEFRIDGVVCERMKFCDIWAAENILFKRSLQESGIPTLTMEREYMLGGSGQMKTRIQAFLETITEEKKCHSPG
jgi:benzoyl-CoA reductase subunit C